MALFTLKWRVTKQPRKLGNVVLHAPKLVVIDRDGTLIKHIPYLCDPDQVEILPTVREGLAKLQTAGCLLFMHTNQAGVGRGYFALEAAICCNNEMLGQLGFGNQLFTEIRICPEAPDEIIEYRKPSPRFGQELLAKYGRDANDLCYLGDNLSDMLTAQNIGCRAIGVNTGVHDLHQELAAHGLDKRFPVCDSFVEAVDSLLTGNEINP